jgi:hypothetical protein
VLNRTLPICVVLALSVAVIVSAACGGGGDDDSDDGTPNATRVSRTGTPPRTGATASGTAQPGTPAAGGTSAATPAPGTTAAAESTNGPPGSLDTPGAAPTVVSSGNTPVADAALPTPSDEERAQYDGIVSDPEYDPSADVTGGDVNAPPEVLNDLPEPPPGATIDPQSIAATNSGAGGIEFILDLSASEPGIQSSRTIDVGDVIRVGVVIPNIPAFNGGEGGLAAFNFVVKYDRNVVVAPTIINGSSLARNPDINEGGLGGDAPGWSCLPPAPEGDIDDPGSFAPGDGDPSTGQAVVSCFGPGGGYASGELVIATIQFQAVGSGTTTLEFDSFALGNAIFDAVATAHGSCEDGSSAPVIPCRSATLTVN